MPLTCDVAPSDTFGRSWTGFLSSLGTAVSISSSSRLAMLLPLAGVLQIQSAPLQAQTDAQWLTERLDSWYHRAQRSAPGEWGIAVADQSGQLLWSANPDQPLMPASTVKLFTTGFARTVLGGTARRPTRVVGVGSLDSASGEWIGSWALEVNGDPSLERAEGSGPTLYDLAMQLAGARGPEADRPAAAPELQRSRERGLSGGLVIPPPGAHLRPAGRPTHPAREHRLGHGPARGPDRAARAGVRNGAGRHRPDGECHRDHPGRAALAARAPDTGRRRLGGDGHDRRAGGAAAPHGRGDATRGRCSSAVWAGALTRAGIAWNPSAYIGATAGRRSPGAGGGRPRLRSTRSPARSTVGASISAPSCCCSGPAGGTAARRC